MPLHARNPAAPARWLRLTHIAAILLAAACLSGCGEGRGDTQPDADFEVAVPDGDAPPCTRDADCSDGLVCNGDELCVMATDGAMRCTQGPPMRCDDGIPCTTDRCSHEFNRCVFTAPDTDGDGHRSAHCLGPDGEALGDDCDDSDGDRYPGNEEVCTPEAPDHDEDCDDRTFGGLDDDGDGVVSAICCNTPDDGTPRCGGDCDDADARRFPEHPEICDDRDNDCDGEVDVGTREVPWYPDLDGDGYGDPDGEAIMSCAPLADHAFRDTDCDDALASVHPAAEEQCDRRDNDCDGDIDEGGVCRCSAPGNIRPCLCGDGSPGLQACGGGGSWMTCDCAECADGAVDCLAGLIPRTCVAGRWQLQMACTGIRPVCAAGRCLCADGSDDCREIVDTVAPFVFATSPPDGSYRVPPDAVISALFNEALAPGSVDAQRVRLLDAFGTPVAADVVVSDASIALTPAQPLPAGMRLTVHIGTGVTDVAGNPLRAEHVFQFATAAVGRTETLYTEAGMTSSAPQMAVSGSGRLAVAWHYNRDFGDAIEVGTAMSTSGSGAPLDAPFFAASSTWRSIAIDDMGRALSLRDDGGAVRQAAHDPVDGWSDGLVMNAVPSPTPALAGADPGPFLTLSSRGSSLDQTSTGAIGHRTTPLAAPARLLAVDIADSGALIGTWLGSDPAEVAAYMEIDAVGVDWVLGTSAGATAALDVAINATGQGMAVWDDAEPGFGTRILAAAAFDAAGPTAVVSNFTGAGSPMAPQVGIDDAGRSTVLWTDGGEPRSAQHTAAGGFAPPHDHGIGSTTATDLGLAVAPGGQVAIVWGETGFDGAPEVWFDYYTPAGGWVGARMLVDPVDHQATTPVMGLDDAGGLRVVSASGGDLLLSRFP